MIIEIKGVQFVNKGAELMLHSIISVLRERYPHVKIVLKSNKNSPYEKRAALVCYQKIEADKWKSLLYLLPKSFRKKMTMKWGIFTDLDIDVVLDASGFAYGDQWGSKKLKKLTTEIEFIKKRGGSYIFLPQALGPFSKASDMPHIKNSFGKADLVCAREANSYQYLEEILGASDKLRIYPDFTNLLKGNCPPYFRDGHKKILIIPNNNMLSRKNENKAWRNSYLDFITASISAVRELGFQPVFLNHGGQEDRKICKEINKQQENAVAIIDEEDPIAVKGVIGESAAVICSRFHGCVSALSQGVPCIGTSWSHKYEELFSEYQRADFLLKSDSEQSDISEKLIQSMSKSDPDYGHYQESIVNYKEQAQNMWRDVFSVINKHS
jgi:colanic acid/amylovoran biosynthesis protein